MFLGRLRVPFPISVQVVESTREIKKKKKSSHTYYRDSTDPTPISWGCYPLVGLGVRFKATLMMILPYQLFLA